MCFIIVVLYLLSSASSLFVMLQTRYVLSSLCQTRSDTKLFCLLYPFFDLFFPKSSASLSLLKYSQLSITLELNSIRASKALLYLTPTPCEPHLIALPQATPSFLQVLRQAVLIFTSWHWHLPAPWRAVPHHCMLAPSGLAAFS